MYVWIRLSGVVFTPDEETVKVGERSTSALGGEQQRRAHTGQSADVPTALLITRKFVLHSLLFFSKLNTII